MGIILSIIAGIFICIQGVFNARISDKIGLWETTTFVHVTGLIVALIVLSFVGNGSFKNIQNVDKLYLISGALGVIIVSSAMKGIIILGPTVAIAIVVITQLLCALVIDTLGLFDSPKLELFITKPIGITIMIVGIIIFNIKK